jgi:hypothetical protein
MQALLLVVENGGPPMFARIGVMRALNRNVERTFNSSKHRSSSIWRANSIAFAFRTTIA